MAETLENIMTFWPSLRYLIRSPFLFPFPLEFFPIFSPCYSIFVVGSEDECRDTSSGHPPASLDRRIRWTSRTRPLKVPATTGRLNGPVPLLVCRVSNSGGCSTRYAGSLNRHSGRQHPPASSSLRLVNGGTAANGYPSSEDEELTRPAHQRRHLHHQQQQQLLGLNGRSHELGYYGEPKPSFIRNQLQALFQPTDNKLVMKIFGSKKTLMISHILMSAHALPQI